MSISETERILSCLHEISLEILEGVNRINNCINGIYDLINEELLYNKEKRREQIL